MEAIKLLVKGDETRTLLDTEVGNALIKAINALLNIQISPAGAGTLDIEEAGSVLALKNVSPITFDAVVNGVLVTVELNGRIIS